jgi:uncharacterized protein (TIGR04255 family)
VEAVIAIEFAPIALNFIDLGQLAGEWREEYPLAEAKEALHPSPPLFAEDLPFIAGFAQDSPAVRLWLREQDSGWLVQIQPDRLVLNWRRTDTDPEYPRYSTLKTEIMRLWSAFLNFLELRDLEFPVPTSFEFTYLNRIVFENPDDNSSAAAFTILNAVPEAMPGDSTFLRFHMLRHLNMTRDGNDGQLEVSSEPDFVDDTIAYVVAVRTRGALKAGTSDSEISTRLDYAHSVGVRAFTAITEDQLHDVWGREK